MSVMWSSSLYAGMNCEEMYIPVVGELISSISAVSRQKVLCVTGCAMDYLYICRYATGTSICSYVPPYVCTYICTLHVMCVMQF